MEEEEDAAAAFGNQRDEIENPEEMDFPSDLMIYWQAWHVLRFDRGYGAFGGETPISFSSISHYAEIYGIPMDSFDDLLRLVMAMDMIYLEVTETKRKEEEARRKANRNIDAKTTTEP